MRWSNLRILWGILLIAGGILFLLQNLNLITFGDIVWSALFLVGGLSFLALYFSNREHWWALIPGFILLGLGLSSVLEELSPAISGAVGGGIFLGSIGLAFFAIYLFHRENWWAIIPGGVLLTLGAVSAIGSVGWDTGALFFLGLALTFLLVAVLPTPGGRMRWAYFPAAILGFIGLLLLFAAGDLINLVVPLALILVGLFLVIRAFWPSRRSLE
jgi:hypothetical protein